MIKVFLDTNTLVSGFVSFKHPERAPAQILHAWRAGLFELCISEHILIELKETFNDPYFQNRLSPDEIDKTVILLSEGCTLISNITPVSGVATHPEDDLIIAAVVSGKVDYFVTGDGSLLRKVGNFYRGAKLVTPNGFLQILKQ